MSVESMQRAPAYLPLYVGDFLAATACWSGEACALHAAMLIKSWGGGALPAKPQRLARLLDVPLRMLSRAWPELAEQWQADADGLRCPWLESKRERLAEISRERADVGRRGGVASAQSKRQAIASNLVQQTGSKTEAIASPPPQQTDSKPEAIASNLLQQNSSVKPIQANPSRSNSGSGAPPERAATSGLSRFRPDDRPEALRIAERARPECDAATIVEKFVPWLTANPSENWPKALETFARGEFFSEAHHEAAKAKHRQADVAAGPALVRQILETQK
jgi:hypothetical protein